MEPYILVVEDSDDDWFIFQRAARKSSCPKRLVRCNSGEQAKGFLLTAETPPWLIVADINMPGMDGIELVEWVLQERIKKLVTRRHVGVPQSTKPAATTQRSDK